MPPGPHLDLLVEAIAVEGDAQRALLDGRAAAARGGFHAAAERYRRSWELAPPASYGRLIGMLKAAVIAGDAADAARYTLEQLPAPTDTDSPPACYARAIALMVLGEGQAAAACVHGMRAGSPAFVRTAAALAGLGARDGEAYSAALREIVSDFEGREAHLTGVPIADTALMLERLAEPRGLACRPPSPLLPVA
jgi:hypothetical protein